MKLAVADLGFLYGKAIVNGKTVKIKDVVGDAVKLRFQDLNMSKKQEDKISLHYPDGEYFVSDLAIAQSPVIDFSLRPDRFNLTPTSVLIDALIGLGLRSGEHDLLIVSGLPVSHYDRYKTDITNLFLTRKNHEFDITMNDKRLNGKYSVIDGKFLPQPFGVLVDAVLDDDGKWKDKDLARKTVAIVDVGFGTTDIYVCNSLDAIEQLTFSTDTAMNHAYNLIALRIEEDFGVSLKLHQIEYIVESKEFRKNGSVYKMGDTIQWACKATAKQLVSEISNKWRGGWRIDEIIVGGGGGFMLFPYVKSFFENIHIAENPQMAVASGYNKWGMKLWRDKLVALHV